MRWGLAILLSLALSSDAVAQPALPEKPILPNLQEAVYCEGYGFLEKDACGILAAANEPQLPVTNADTKLAFRLSWSRGGEFINQAIMLRFEIQSATKGFLEAFAMRSGSRVGIGSEEITPAEIGTVLDAASKAGFWALPLTGGTPLSENGPGGVEITNLCRHGLTLSGVELERRKVLERRCPTDKTDPALLQFARTLVRIAQRYRSWVAADAEFWPDIR
jgi:hypothetical protein